MPEEFTAEESAAMEAMKTGVMAPTEEREADKEADNTVEAEAVEAKDEIVAEADKEADNSEADKVKTVPHQAMHAERVKRQETERLLREAEARHAALELQVKQAQAPEAPMEQPDPLADPEGFKAWSDNRFEASEKSVAQMRAAFHQQDQETRMNAVASQVVADYEAEKPDYQDAYKHLRADRGRELGLLGVPRENIKQQIDAEERNIFVNAMQNGHNPAKMIYDLAEGRGYGRAAPVEAKATEADKMAAKTLAQAATESLAGAGGGGGDTTLTLEKLSRMSQSEMATLKDKDPEKYRKALGG